MEQQANNMSTYSGTQSPIETKFCTKCGRALPLSNFCRSARNKDGLQSWCKDCQKETNRKRNESLQKTASRQTAVHQSDGRNPELAKFKPVQLIDELRARGYRGTLTYTYEITL
jgi:hypothetical protein